MPKELGPKPSSLVNISTLSELCRRYPYVTPEGTP